MAVTTPESLVSEIHSAPLQAVLAITGGGTGAIAQLLQVPGGSRTLLEAIVPYSANSLTEFLHALPEHFCSARTGRAMAMAAFMRAQQLSAEKFDHSQLVGIGCTASLLSDRPKRGTHRIHVASQSPHATITHSLELAKGARSRFTEEQVAAWMTLNALAEAFRIDEQLPLQLLAQETVRTTRTEAPAEWKDLLLGRVGAIYHDGSSAAKKWSIDNQYVDSSKPGLIFPGAFNPLHVGHIRMADFAAKRFRLPVEFEVSIENVDKPPLDYTEMEYRAAQFVNHSKPLWFSRAPTFLQKSRIFPGVTMIVGTDTIKRIAEPRYYRHSPVTAAEAIDEIAQHNCRFFVFGRLSDNQFETLDDLSIPLRLRELCEGVSLDEFRVDISSTELRRQAADAEL